MPADGDDGHDDAVACQVPAVTKHFVADFSDPRGIDEHATGGRLVCNASAMGIELNDVAVLREQHLDVTIRAAHDLGRNPRVLRELPIFAVDRDEVARPHEREHELQLLGRAVT